MGNNVNKMHGNTGKRHASKPADERATSFLHIRVLRADKAHWVRQAQAESKKLSVWVIEKLGPTDV